jgi:DNA-binding NtrC family response regulator
MHVQLSPCASHYSGNHPGLDTISFLDDSELVHAARTDACVLFTGPAQVRTLALRIHSLSGWRWGGFKAVDCGAPTAVLEQQLFDVLHGDAAPETGGDVTVRLRQPGTLFLHEVGRLSGTAQVRLRNLIGDVSRPSRVARVRRRIMASTSEPLLPAVMNGTFDDQLYYRLNVIHFVLHGGSSPA